MRDQIEKFLTEWERKSKNSMFLDGPLHPKIRKPLVDGLVAIFDVEMAKPPLTVAAVDEVLAQIKPKKGKSR